MGPGRVPDCDQCRRAVEAAGGDCVGRRDVARDAGAEGDGGGGDSGGLRDGRRRRFCRERWSSTRSISASAGARRRRSGKKLKTLSKGQQVLCITHLPQIAAFADQHFLIEKSEKRGRTQTEVRRMEDSERTQEIARMLSGAKLTETSLKHAAHLLESSR